jgi:hypothetical protein
MNKEPMKVFSGREWRHIAIQPGDMWGTIAERYGTTLQELRDANRENHPHDRLYITEILWVPANEEES